MTKRRRLFCKRKWQRAYADRMKAEYPEWTTWKGMKMRCSDTRHKDYGLYGGKGVKVCERWKEHGKGFLSFIADMGRRPNKDYDLDRVDSDGDYCVENCRWLHYTLNRATNVKPPSSED